MSSAMASVHSLFNNKSMRSVLLKLRAPLTVLGLVALLFLIRAEWFLPGVIISAVGTLTQIWCFGCIKTRKVLAHRGPYMFVRNPMYLTRYLAILGILVMTGNPWILVAFTVIYYFYMVNRVRREEPVLREVFGEDYEAYIRDVPRFFPGYTRRFELKNLWGIEVENLKRQHAGIHFLGMLGLYAICWVFAFVVNG